MATPARNRNPRGSGHGRAKLREYLLHNRLAGRAGYVLHGDILNSDAIVRIKQRYATWLLPMVFAEGCPVHPSYGAGHATVAGACITVCKALFDENFPIPNPLVPSADGQTLEPYTGPGANQL